MKVQQISVFLENRAGRLSAVINLIAKANINIRALSLADTNDFGILRLIVDKPEEAERLLRENRFTLNVTDVVAIEIPDRPGGLGHVLGILQQASVNVEYMYAFVEKNADKAVVVFRFDNLDRVLQLLGTDGLKILTRDEVLAL
jgi:hypothetical protein